MAKKEFFSSFEKNLSLEDGNTSTIAAPPKAKAVAKAPVAKKNITNITGITKKVEKAPKPKESRVAKTKTNLSKVATFRINADLLEQMKAVAHWDRKKIQDVIDEALGAYIKKVPKEDLSQAMALYSKA